MWISGGKAAVDELGFINFRKTFIPSQHVAELLAACFHTVRRLKAAPVLPSFVVICSQQAIRRVLRKTSIQKLNWS